MPVAPARLQQAKQALLKAYAKAGGMPSVRTFAETMGYSSTASAFEVTEALVEEGFLRKSASGRLLPGPTFEFSADGPDLPAELAALLPPGKVVRLLAVRDGSLQGDGILKGDFLVVVGDGTPGYELLVLSKGRKLRLATALDEGWTSEGRLVAQFRSYR